MSHSFPPGETARHLDFAVDVEARHARFPPDFMLKGMFFSRICELGPRFAEAVKPKLLAPPRTGRYIPFSDYPQADFSRISHAVATGLYPSLPVPEAMRRLARRDFSTFAESSIGRVSLALIGDLRAAILKMPDLYAAVLRGGTMSARAVGPDQFELTFKDFYGWVDCYPFGQFEGLVQKFGKTCRVDVSANGGVDAIYKLTVVGDQEGTTS